MSDTAYVEAARGWSNRLLQREARGPGDLENAMRRLEQRYGIPAQVFWSLRYRPPKDLLTGVFMRLRQAYLTECERQIRLLEHEIATTKQVVGDDAAATRAVAPAEAFVAEATTEGEALK